MKNSFLLFALLFSISACNSQTKVENNPVVIEKTAEVSTEILLPPPAEYLIDLANKSTGIEATMYQSGGSFSLWEKKSIAAFMSLISTNAPKVTSGNQLGHMMFLENGNMLTMAKIYDNGSDVYAKFELDNQTYYSVLLGQAKDMFTNVKVKQAE